MNQSSMYDQTLLWNLYGVFTYLLHVMAKALRLGGTASLNTTREVSSVGDGLKQLHHPKLDNFLLRLASGVAVRAKSARQPMTSKRQMTHFGFHIGRRAAQHAPGLLTAPSGYFFPCDSAHPSEVRPGRRFARSHLEP